MPIRICLLVALALTAGAGCGRRGALEAPGATTQEKAAGEAGTQSSASPGAQEPGALQPGEAAPQRRFVLDPLI